MRQEEMGHRLTAIARMSSEAAQLDAIRQQADTLVRAAAGIEVVLRICAKDEKGRRRDVACALLSAALDAARMAAENGSPHGPRFIAAVEAAVRQLAATEGLDAESRIRLAQVYARAELEAPTDAKLTPEMVASTTTQVVQQMPDVAGMLTAVLRQAGQDPLRAHASLGEALAALPDDARAGFVQVISSQDGPVAQRLALYWLLDRVPGVRLAAATALLGRANADQLEAQVASSLPSIRKWLPAEPARAMVDAAIRASLRRGGAPAPRTAWKVRRATASLPDGAGAQSIAALVQQGRRRGVALLLLKQGHGVKDAFIQDCASVSEQERFLGEIGRQIALFEIRPDYIPAALSRALGDGAAHGSLPAAGLIDMAEIWGGEALTPDASDPPAILAAIGGDEALATRTDAERDALLGLCGAMVADLEHFDSWFEDSASLAEQLTAARGRKGREAAVWRHLEVRRDWWARQLAVCAATLRAASVPDPAMWLAFAASAGALVEQCALRRIPIMEHVADLTLGVADGRPASKEPEGPPLRAKAPRPAKRGELGQLLAGTGVSEAYVQGYLTALAVAPRPVSLQAWLGTLLGGVEFRGEGKVQRVVDVVIMRATQLDRDAGDQATMSKAIAALDEGALRDWASGFSALVAATKGAWPAGALAAADRRMLRTLEMAGKDGDMDGLRAVLPSWITARHALRR